MKKARAANKPACQPACHNADSDLSGDGAFVQCVKCLPVHTDAERKPSAGWLRCFARTSPLAWVALGCFRHALDMDARGATIQELQWENRRPACLSDHQDSKGCGASLRTAPVARLLGDWTFVPALNLAFSARSASRFSTRSRLARINSLISPFMSAISA